MSDIYTHVRARLDATPFPMSDDTRREYEDMQELLRALLVERELTTRTATGAEYASAHDAIEAALHKFAGVASCQMCPGGIRVPGCDHGSGW